MDFVEDDAYVIEKAREEGLAYFVTSYTSGEKFENPVFRDLHQKAAAAMDEYQKALDKRASQLGLDKDDA